MRFLILNSVDPDVCRALAAGELREDEAERRLTGCTWLFRASPEVDDAEQALREAVRDYFSSDPGRRVLRGEEVQRLGWEAAIPWIPDETWARFGLEAIRHPDVERVVLDGGEDLAEGLPPHPAG